MRTNAVIFQIDRGGDNNEVQNSADSRVIVAAPHSCSGTPTPLKIRVISSEDLLTSLRSVWASFFSLH